MDYTFGNLAGPKNDITGIDDQMLQNMNYCNYNLQNFVMSNNTENTIQFATSQPGIVYSGPIGFNVDVGSELQTKSKQTHPRGHIDLFQRPFSTVPFLGRGAANPYVESQIQQGEMGSNRNSITNVTEKNYTNYYAVPLIPSVREKINNPSYLVEGVASEGWIRGGLPSREMNRDVNNY